ncbi:condensation domain-containing protein [Agarivorans sp. DSG3-1]|uniref:condensation domain-containing protein n=1 Tax=Agarivorans sp. DSG3-1 TaxID=3342249 RepID=UPI00398E765F
MTIRPLGVTEALFAELTSTGAMLVVNAVCVRGQINPAHIAHIHQLLQQRHPLLSVCLSQVDEQWQWLPSSKPPSVEVIEFNGDDAVFPQFLTEHMQQQTNTPLSASGLLWRVRVLIGAEQSALIVSMHHSICDGLSATALLAEWLERHQQVAEQQAPQFVPFAIRQCVHHAIPDIDLSTGESPFCSPITPEQTSAWLSQTSPQSMQQNKLALLAFSQQQTTQLLALARENHVSLTILLYTAAVETALALAKSNTTLVSAGGNANVRPIVEPPADEHELACYVSMFSFAVDCSAEQTFWQRAQQVNALYQQQVNTGLHLVSCSDEWWQAQAPRRADDDMKQVAGRFNCLHLSNLGNIAPLFAQASATALVPQQYYFTAAQHLIGAIFWLGSQSLAGALTVTINCVEPMISAEMRNNFVEQFKQCLLAMSDG